MSIRIIGAGLPRTGTNSLKSMLETLGYAKTYHLKDLLNRPQDLRYWKQMQQSGSMPYDEIYLGYQASVDFPCYAWYKEHMLQYPNAKVILTVRPFEAWYDSVKTTIWVAGPQTPIEKLRLMSQRPLDNRLRMVFKCIRFVKLYLWESQFHGRFLDKAYVKTIWEKHIAEVKAHVPAEKLLVYDLNDGFEPLCSFLKMPIPEHAMPHLNKKADFKSMLDNLVMGKAI